MPQKASTTHEELPTPLEQWIADIGVEWAKWEIFPDSTGLSLKQGECLEWADKIVRKQGRHDNRDVQKVLRHIQTIFGRDIYAICAFVSKRKGLKTLKNAHYIRALDDFIKDKTVPKALTATLKELDLYSEDELPLDIDATPHRSKRPRLATPEASELPPINAALGVTALLHNQGGTHPAFSYQSPYSKTQQQHQMQTGCDPEDTNNLSQPVADELAAREVDTGDRRQGIVQQGTSTDGVSITAGTADGIFQFTLSVTGLCAFFLGEEDDPLEVKRTPSKIIGHLKKHTIITLNDTAATKFAQFVIGPNACIDDLTNNLSTPGSLTHGDVSKYIKLQKVLSFPLTLEARRNETAKAIIGFGDGMNFELPAKAFGELGKRKEEFGLIRVC